MVRLAFNMDATAHERVPYSADFGALDIELPFEGGLEPAGNHAPRNGVLLEPPHGNGEVVKHILRLKLEVVKRIGLDMELVDRPNVIGGIQLAVGTFVDKGPRPLLADDPYLGLSRGGGPA